MSENPIAADPHDDPPAADFVETYRDPWLIDAESKGQPPPSTPEELS